MTAIAAPSAYINFTVEFESLVEQINSEFEKGQFRITRTLLHTAKANARLFEMMPVVDCLQRLEDMTHKKVSEKALLEEAWGLFHEASKSFIRMNKKVMILLGQQNKKGQVITNQVLEIQALVKKVREMSWREDLGP